MIEYLLAGILFILIFISIVAVAILKSLYIANKLNGSTHLLVNAIHNFIADTHDKSDIMLENISDIEMHTATASENLDRIVSTISEHFDQDPNTH